MQQQLSREDKRLKGELDRIERILRRCKEDESYTRQYFSIGRQAHVRSTQSLGTPALVWHVAFWPRRQKDPQGLDGEPEADGGAAAPNGGCPKGQRPLTQDEARRTYDALRKELAEDLDELLEKLQRKGRVPSGSGQSKGVRIEKFGAPEPPADWNGDETPVKVYPTESIAFTIWWSDNTRDECPEKPSEADLRVRVQADIHPDFATITFIIDAGKTWEPGEPDGRKTYVVCDRPPASGTGRADETEDDIAQGCVDIDGERRRRIFHAARIVRKMADDRLEEEEAHKGKPAADAGAQGGRLRWASDILYDQIWDEFSKAFGCWLDDIAGKTDEVFANFRGVVLAVPPRNANAAGGKGHLSRFVYGTRNGRGGLDEPYPSSVVRAYWPFVRRTRSEADHRDWIACGVFDWRALYITALGGKSDFDPNDERADKNDATLPTRAFKDGVETERQAELMKLDGIERQDTALRTRIEKLRSHLKSWDPNREPAVASTPQGDLPRPFHYLFLTSGEPNRRQAGRIVDRVNMLGTVRLYTMKDFSIIRDADVHLRMYGQLLDRIMSNATEEIRKTHETWWDSELSRAEEGLSYVSGDLPKAKAEPGSPKAVDLPAAHKTCLDRAKDERQKLDAWVKKQKKGELLISEEPLMLYRQLLADIVAAAPEGTNLDKNANNVFAKAQQRLIEARKAKSRHDEELALLNRQTDLDLTRIKTYIDRLGQDAIGGLPFRINRARYYATIYRNMVKTLRVGSIDTWWDYEQLATRGVDPALRFVEDVGDRLEKLRARLRDAMEAVQTSAIANQTEATRDNTYQLEVIAAEMRNVVVRVGSLIAKTEDVRLELYDQKKKNEEQLAVIIELQREIAEIGRRTAVIENRTATIDQTAAGARLGGTLLDILTSPGLWAFLMFIVFCLDRLFRSG